MGWAAWRHALRDAVLALTGRNRREGCDLTDPSPREAVVRATLLSAGDPGPGGMLRSLGDAGPRAKFRLRRPRRRAAWVTA